MARQLREFPLWGPVARDVLLQTGGRYRAVITYSELATEVQQRTGASTKQPMRHRIGSLLEEVALLSHRLGDPSLTSLCVHQDGSIGEGYSSAVHLTEGSVVDDVEVQAADDRLLCYRSLAKDLPPDGGRAALTTKVAERRSRAATRSRTAQTSTRPSLLCDRCHTALPATGQCDYCD